MLHDALHPLPHDGAVLNLSEGLLAAHLLAHTPGGVGVVGLVLVGVVGLVGADHALLLSHHDGDLQAAW